MSESVYMSKKSVYNGFVSKETGGDHSGYNVLLLGYFEWLTIVLYMIFFHHIYTLVPPRYELVDLLLFFFFLFFLS